jgi:hypothetical protein
MGWSPRPERWRLEPVPRSEPVSLAWRLAQSQVLRRLAFSRQAWPLAWRQVLQRPASQQLAWQPVLPQRVWQRV